MFYATFISRFRAQLQKALKRYSFGGLAPKRARLGRYYIFNTYLVIGVSQCHNKAEGFIWALPRRFLHALCLVEMT